MRKHLGANQKRVAVDKLIVACEGPASTFVQRVASSWTVVGTLIMSDQPIVSVLNARWRNSDA